MTCNPVDVDVEPVAPDSAQGRLVLGDYFRDIVNRYHGREAARHEVDDAMNAEPSDDLCPPRGLVLVARHGGAVIGGAVIGCAGLRLVTPEIGEERADSEAGGRAEGQPVPAGIRSISPARPASSSRSAGRRVRSRRT